MISTASSVARGVVVKQDELADVGGAGELDGGLPGGVAPAHAAHPALARVLRGEVLRVVDEHVGVAGERGEARVDAAEVLGVGGVHHGAPAVLDPVRVHLVGVVGLRDRDLRLARDEALAVAHLQVAQRRGELVEVDREGRRAHLAAEDVTGGRPVGARHDVDPRRGRVDGGEEGEALDVVPVDVREEEGHVDRALLHELVAEAAEPRPRVEHDA
jgi:hypothetical protein